MVPTTVDTGNEDHISSTPKRKPGRLGWLFFTFLFVLFALFVSATGAFVFMRYLPERDQAQANAKALAEKFAGN